MDAASPKEPAQGADKPAAPVPQGVWGTILTTTPIVLTVLATAFAGLSSSEMTQSMYYRSLAAQHQSKAGDQWAFFQAKRSRRMNLEMTVKLLQALKQLDDFDPAQIDAVCAQVLEQLDKAGDSNKAATAAAAKVKKIREKLAALLADDKNKASLRYLSNPAVVEDEFIDDDKDKPTVPAATNNVPKATMRRLEQKDAQEAIDAVVKAIDRRQTESETAALVSQVNASDIEAATRLAEEDADRFDQECEPINATLDQLATLLADLGTAVKPFRPAADARPEDRAPLAQVPALTDRLNISFKVAELEFQARRYRQEMLLNRHAAHLYEVRVRRSGVTSDRHRERSKMFFYCMLLAQAGVTIASLALARTQRSLLWLAAALAGVIALAFSAYVYLLY